MKSFLNQGSALVLSLIIAFSVFGINALCTDIEKTEYKKLAEKSAVLQENEKKDTLPEVTTHTEISEVDENSGLFKITVTGETIVKAEPKSSSAPACGNKLTSLAKILYNHSQQLAESIVSGDTDCPIMNYFNASDELTEKESTALYDTLIVDDISIFNLEKEDTKLVEIPPEVPGGETSYTFPEALNTKATEYFTDLLNKSFDSNTVLNSLLADNPYKLFWFDKKKGLHTYFTYTIFGSADDNYITSVYVSDEYPIRLCIALNVSEDYAGNSYYIMNKGTPNETHFDAFDLSSLERVNAAKAVADGIIEENKSKSDMEKLRAYHDKICSLATYNSAASKPDTTIPYGDPWQMIYVFDGDKDTEVVCEGYAKAFKYLCDNTVFSDNRIYCILVTGNLYQNEKLLGEHMWNIVHYSDGINYLVDATNDDSSGSYPLFMKNAQGGKQAEKYIYSYVGTTYLSYEYDEFQAEIFDEEDLTLKTEYELGDVNLDKKINVCDCVSIYLSLDSCITLDYLQTYLGNVNFDSVLDEADALDISKYCGRIIEAF